MEEAAGHELSHLEFLELILQDELLRNPLHDDDQQPTAGGLGQVDRRRPHATAILDRFLHHAEVIAITGKSYRLRNQATPANSSADESKPANLPTGSAGRKKPKPAAETTIAATVAACEK